MTKHTMRRVAGIAVISVVAASVFAHCQIPCGIYDDAARFTLMKEHVTTIEKSMKEIEKVAKDESGSKNQLVRWVSNKENHADELAEIVTYYFMAQRVKPVAEEKKAEHGAYVKKLTLLHGILIESMKAKQTTDLERCKEMRALIDQFEKAYSKK